MMLPYLGYYTYNEVKIEFISRINPEIVALQ